MTLSLLVQSRTMPSNKKRKVELLGDGRGEIESNLAHRYTPDIPHSHSLSKCTHHPDCANFRILCQQTHQRGFVIKLSAASPAHLSL
jgi:hypothetical protein